MTRALLLASLGLALTGLHSAHAGDDDYTPHSLNSGEIDSIKRVVRDAIKANVPHVDFGDMASVRYPAKGITIVCGAAYRRQLGTTTTRIPFLVGTDGSAFEVLELGENALSAQSIDRNCARQDIGAF